MQDTKQFALLVGVMFFCSSCYGNDGWTKVKNIGTGVYNFVVDIGRGKQAEETLEALGQNMATGQRLADTMNIAVQAAPVAETVQQAAAVVQQSDAVAKSVDALNAAAGSLNSAADTLNNATTSIQNTASTMQSTVEKMKVAAEVAGKHLSKFDMLLGAGAVITIMTGSYRFYHFTKSCVSPSDDEKIRKEKTAAQLEALTAKRILKKCLKENIDSARDGSGLPCICREAANMLALAGEQAELEKITKIFNQRYGELAC